MTTSRSNQAATWNDKLSEMKLWVDASHEAWLALWSGGECRGRSTGFANNKAGGQALQSLLAGVFGEAKKAKKNGSDHNSRAVHP